MTLLPSKFGIYGGQFVPETLMPALIELEEAFVSAKADAESPLPDGVEVQMLELDWVKLNKRNGETPEVTTDAAAQAIVQALEAVDYTVGSVATREKKRNPVPPFITSTLQQESSRKLRFSVKRTMGLAQRLPSSPPPNQLS